MVYKAKKYLIAATVAFLLTIGGVIPTTESISAEKNSYNTEIKSLPNLSGDEAKDFLKEQGLYQSLGEAMEAAKYSIYPAKSSPFENQNALYASNPRQAFSTYFSTNGVHIVSESPGNKWKIGMNLERIGHGEDLQTVESGEMNVQANKSHIEIEKFQKRREENQSKIQNPQSEIVEWYKNSENGLEQGWTIAEKLNDSDEGLRLVLSVDSNLRMKLAKDARAVDFVREDNSPVVRYDKLKSWDADGRELASRMEVKENQISLVIDDKNAKYPITVDPFFTQTKILTASDAAEDDRFGEAVAISGNTAIVGASELNAAYIFERNTGGANSWGEVQKIDTSEAIPAFFGLAVAISDDTAIVGDWGVDSGSVINSGAAYIFERNTGGANNWGEVKKLTAPVAVTQDRFGYSVSISGGKVIVGAPQPLAMGDGGSAYIFGKNVGGANNWGQVKELVGSDVVGGDSFGHSVSISGNAAIVGAYLTDTVAVQTGAAYVFEQNNGGADNWGEVKKLVASDAALADFFGYSVGISGDTAIVGAYQENGNRGAAYIFSKNTGGASQWGQVKKLTSSTSFFLGWSVAISGDTAVVGAPTSNNGSTNSSGSAYIFERNIGGADNWGEAQKLVVADPVANDNFGQSVAISGDTTIVGIKLNILGSTENGKAYIFTNQDNNWQQVTTQTSRDGRVNNQFGYSVAISGNRAVVGVPFDNAAGIVSGAAYVFYRNTNGTDGWGQFKRLTGSDTVTGDEFGYSAAIENDKIIVGSRSNDGNKGAAYIFYRNQGGADNWGQIKKLVAADAATGDNFGVSVSISGTTAIVGANENDDSGSSSGSAYIFEQNLDDRGAVIADFWGQRRKLLASDGGNLDFFGTSVSISGDTAIVGAIGENSDKGAAYLFGRNTGGTRNWGQIKKLTASNQVVSRFFGRGVSISGDTLIVGALEIAGAVYIFERNSDGSGGVLADNWGEVKKILSPSSSFNGFGYSVSISNDKAIVGARLDDENGIDSGAAYIFERNTGGSDMWGEVQRLTASDRAAGDNFGFSVAISDDKAIVGSPFKDIAAPLAENKPNNEFRNATEINSSKNSSNLAGADQGGMYIFSTSAAPTAASASISGRVLEADGVRGVPNAVVQLTGQDGTVRTTRTNPFGYFRFENIEVGQTLILNVYSKRYQFSPQIINLQDSISDLRITAN